jgi:WD40 repeat protein
MAKALQSDEVEDQLKAESLPGRRRIANVWIMAGSENGKVIIWDLQTREVLQVLSAHTAPVLAVAVSHHQPMCGR